jgi:hypothetical protein
VKTTSVVLAWNASTDDSGIKNYSVYRNGKRLANPTKRSYTFTGLACGTTYTLGVDASDAAGNRSARTSRSVKTAACPPKPTPKVTLSKGGSAQGLTGCSSIYCRYMNVTFKNFPSGTHTIRCRASHGDEGGFYTYTRSGTSNSSAVCYYGFLGRTAWVTVDGVSSNKIVW